MNPKDLIGSKKICLSNCPIEVLLEVACALTEGRLKYGPYNWRHQDVNMTVYTDAAIRHIASFQVREDIDPDSGLHHITKAIASLIILRDAIIHDCVNDDRPVDGLQLQAELNDKVAALHERYAPKPEPPAPRIQLPPASPTDRLLEPFPETRPSLVDPLVRKYIKPVSPEDLFEF